MRIECGYISLCIKYLQKKKYKKENLFAFYFVKGNYPVKLRYLRLLLVNLNCGKTLSKTRNNSIYEMLFITQQIDIS